jgi:hypothetical protein
LRGQRLDQHQLLLYFGVEIAVGHRRGRQVGLEATWHTQSTGYGSELRLLRLLRLLWRELVRHLGHLWHLWDVYRRPTRLSGRQEGQTRLLRRY